MELMTVVRGLVAFGAGVGVQQVFVLLLKRHSLEQIEAMSKRKGLAILVVVCIVFFVAVMQVFCHSERVLDFLTNK
jgi:hypothetical protein